MKITITRHSKTLWNKEKRLQGCKDSPLSPEGMDNILALKEHIKNNHYDAIIPVLLSVHMILQSYYLIISPSLLMNAFEK